MLKDLEVEREELQKEKAISEAMELNKPFCREVVCFGQTLLRKDDPKRLYNILGQALNHQPEGSQEADSLHGTLRKGRESAHLAGTVE